MATPSGTSPREVEAAIDALYQGSLERFTTDRNALAAALKQGGDKAAAERVKALAKPSVTAWAVNQAWWRRRDLFQSMLDAGAAQRKAHVAWAQGRKADVRAAGETRRAAVNAVKQIAVEALGGGKPVAPDVQYRIAGTVEALASSGVPEGEQPGRLTRDLQSSGLDALTALAEAAGAIERPRIVARGAPSELKPATAPPATEPRGATTPASAKTTGRDAAETARERKAREAAEAAARAHAERVREAEARVRVAAEELENATRAATDASDAEARARAAVEDATRRREEIEAALDEARAAEAARRRDASSATTASSRADLDRARAVREAARADEALARLVREGPTG